MLLFEVSVSFITMSTSGIALLLIQFLAKAYVGRHQVMAQVLRPLLPLSDTRWNSWIWTSAVPAQALLNVSGGLIIWNLLILELPAHLSSLFKNAMEPVFNRETMGDQVL